MSALEKNFLVIDPDETFRQVLKNHLVRIGHTHISEATTAKEALEIINSTYIDYILCDWDLPRANGYSLLKLIRMQERFKNTRFIMMSDSKEHVQDRILSVRSLDVAGYLLKPFDLSSLERLLKT